MCNAISRAPAAGAVRRAGVGFLPGNSPLGPTWKRLPRCSTQSPAQRAGRSTLERWLSVSRLLASRWRMRPAFHCLRLIARRHTAARIPLTMRVSCRAALAKHWGVGTVTSSRHTPAERHSTRLHGACLWGLGGPIIGGHPGCGFLDPGLMTALRPHGRLWRWRRGSVARPKPHRGRTAAYRRCPSPYRVPCSDLSPSVGGSRSGLWRGHHGPAGRHPAPA